MEASRDRLLSTDHPFFSREPYFSKSVVDAILTLSMRAGTLETTLRDLPETKAAVLFKGWGGGELCAPHELALIFHRAFGLFTLIFGGAKPVFSNQILWYLYEIYVHWKCLND